MPEPEPENYLSFSFHENIFFEFPPSKSFYRNQSFQMLGHLRFLNIPNFEKSVLKSKLKSKSELDSKTSLFIIFDTRECIITFYNKKDSEKKRDYKLVNDQPEQVFEFEFLNENMEDIFFKITAFSFTNLQISSSRIIQETSENFKM